jgi:flagellar protein FliJ
MKSREMLVRLKKSQINEKRRKVAQIERLIAEFERIAIGFESEIQSEQDRAGIHDPAHFAYPTYATAIKLRRENVERTIGELKIQVEDAKAALGEALEEMRKVELFDQRDQMREAGRSQI